MSPRDTKYSWTPEPYWYPQTRSCGTRPPFPRDQSPAQAGLFFSRNLIICRQNGERHLNVDIQGGCMCGAVRYSATTAPANSMVCHCESCRRSAASPVVAWVTFAKAEFRFTRGTPREYQSSPKV